MSAVLAKLRNAALELLAQSHLRDDELEAHLKNALDPDYWKNLNPRLSVGQETANEVIEGNAIDLETHRQLLRKLSEEGYFQIPPLLADSMTERMRQCIEVLRNKDWPPVFCFVYDQFWTAFRGPSLAQFLSDVLQPGYKQVPLLWAHYVTPQSSGWGPHVDDGYGPAKISLWVPLTDATLDNGCMYLVPQNKAPEGFPEKLQQLERFDKATLLALLQGARALPCRAGSFLGWRPTVIHWGARSGETSTPRVSFAVEFVSGTAKPEREDMPLLDAHSSPPSFKARLCLIAKAIQIYEAHEARMVRYRRLAERLAEHTTERAAS